MTRRPTAAVYRRRRIVVGLGAVTVVVLVVWLIAAAVSAIGNSHDKAAAQASASAYASVQNSTSATLSIPAVPVGGICDPADIVVKPATAAGHATDPVPLAFQVFTQRNPQCRWAISHNSVEITLTRGGQVFWSTDTCPQAVKRQAVTLRQGIPLTLTLATWNGHGSSAAGGCGGQAPWSAPGAYVLYGTAKGGNPSMALLTLVAPGDPLPKPTATVAPSASAKPKASGTATARPTATTAPTPTAAPTTTVW